MLAYPAPSDTTLTLAGRLATYRQHPREVERVSRLLALLPSGGSRALDIGARDGHLSLLLAERFEQVLALDLQRPQIEHPRIECMAGDAARLALPDRSVQTVLCAEVLEHIPPPLLPQVCRELARVADRHVVIGVPFRQDLRVDCTSCRRCGATNPPWGHVNSFDLPRLCALMPDMVVAAVDHVGRSRAVSNAASAALLRFAGHPYGTYEQDEPCVHCGAPLQPPGRRNLAQKVATKLAYWGIAAQTALTPWRPNWLHVRFERRPAS